MEKELIGNWKRKTRTKQYDNNWISIYHDEVVNPGGGDGVYGVVHYKHLAIGIIPIDERGYTWLVGQHRYPQNKFSWEIPEGGGKLNVPPVESAKRELKEEVGLKAQKWKLILNMDLSNSVSDEEALIYMATNLELTESEPEETEELQVKHLPFEKAYQMVLNGEITDSMSVAGLLRANLLIENLR